MSMRGHLTGIVYKYSLKRKAKCWLCSKPIEKEAVRWEAQLEMKDHYNPYWTNWRDARIFELSVIICDKCKTEGYGVFGLRHDAFIETTKEKYDALPIKKDPKVNSL